MTGVTLIAGRDVGCSFHLRVDANIGAAVAGGALAGRAGVIHLRWGKGNIILVAAVAGCCARNMRDVLAKGAGSVVAGGAAAGSNSLMAKINRLPRSSRMAGVAGLRCGYVRCRLALGVSTGVCAVVA